MRQTARFSFLSLLRQRTGKPWDGQRRDAPRKASYRVVIVGAGGHRLATAMAVDIIQYCAVTAIVRDAAGSVADIETTCRLIAVARLYVVAAGHTGRLMAMAAARMPLDSYNLVDLASEPMKPVMPRVVRSNVVHARVPQSDERELVIGVWTNANRLHSRAGGMRIGRGEPHPLAAPFALDRFAKGRLTNGASAAAHRTPLLQCPW